LVGVGPQFFSQLPIEAYQLRFWRLFRRAAAIETVELTSVAVVKIEQNGVAWGVVSGHVFFRRWACQRCDASEVRAADGRQIRLAAPVMVPEIRAVTGFSGSARRSSG
jgi:hypothetical protein